MNGRSKIFRGIVALAAGMVIVLGAAAPVNAGLPGVRNADSGIGERLSGASATACPAIGQRVKTSSAPDTYLVGPGYDLYYIPGNVYFNLWDSYAGIVTNNSLWSCYGGYYTLSGAELVKLSSSPYTYIYDASYGQDRWIVDGATFNKYGFSWSKIKIVSVIIGPGPNWT